MTLFNSKITNASETYPKSFLFPSSSLLSPPPPSSFSPPLLLRLSSSPPLPSFLYFLVCNPPTSSRLTERTIQKRPSRGKRRRRNYLTPSMWMAACSSQVPGWSLELEPGTSYALVGPNNSGKSTLLQQLHNAATPAKRTALVSFSSHQAFYNEYGSLTVARTLGGLITTVARELIARFGLYGVSCCLRLIRLSLLSLILL